MKAVLLIDVPEDYTGSVICAFLYGKKRTIHEIYTNKLRPLPKKKPVSYHDDLYGDIEKNFNNIGWNACLEEIEG